MSLVKLDKSQWHGFFDGVSKVLPGKRAHIEVASLDLGHRVEAAWLPLLGFVYEPKTDVLEIALEDVDHRIRKPREIVVDEAPLGLTFLEVVDAEGRKHIVRLREPLMLAAN